MNGCYHLQYDTRRIEAMNIGTGLTIGARDPAITEIQNYLKRYNYLTCDTTLSASVFDDVVATGIRRFQRSNGLPETGVFDSLTRAAMVHPRCGMIDFTMRVPFLTGARRWEDMELRYDFGDIAVTPEQPIEPDDLREAVAEAARTWQQADVGLTIREARNGERAHMRVAWVPANDPDGVQLSGRAIAHADVPPDGGRLPPEPLPIHLDYEEHAWAVGAVEGHYDIESVVLHEIGHCLGLGHSELRNAVMFNVVFTSVLKRGLDASDLAALRTLYTATSPRGTPAAVRAENGMYVRAENGGGGSLFADRRRIREWETFHYVNVGPTVNPGLRIGIRAHEGQYLRAINGGGGDVQADRPWIQEWETFAVIELGNDQIAFQSHDGHYLQIDGNGRVRATATTIRDPGATFLTIRL